MTERLRRTVRSFLRRELPATQGEAMAVAWDWFGRYDPDPNLLEEEIARHFADQRSQAGDSEGYIGGGRGGGAGRSDSL